MIRNLVYFKIVINCNFYFKEKNMFQRPSNRQFNEMREIKLKSQVSPYAEGSCMAKFGNRILD